MIAEMGGLAERQIVEAIEALTKRNTERAGRVIAADAAIDSLQRSIEQRAVETIARRQPMAIDLREVVGVLRISNELERIGDLAKNIGKRVIALDGGDISRRSMRGVRHMASLALAQLQDLTRVVIEMGGLAERQIVNAIEALDKHDTTLAQRVIADDVKIDGLQREIEDKAILTIARRQPMAIDLREVVGALRLANDLERIGDLAKNIAKRVGALDSDFQPQQVMRGVEHMTDLVLAQIKEVLDSFAHRDATKALAVWRGDEEVDAVNNSLFRELLTYMMEDPRNISYCIHLLFCAKNIERMGDHATNIAETVYYMVEGRTLSEERPKGDTTATTSVPFRK